MKFTTYTPQFARVSVCFYKTNNFRSKVIRWFTRSQVNHCGIMLTFKNTSLILVSDTGHRAKFVDATNYHKRVIEPSEICELGVGYISIQQLTTYLKHPYIGDVKSVVWWFFFGRWFLPLHVPPSCTTITTRILRLCGWYVKDFVEPNKLYKELKNENDLFSWSSPSG